jgi:transposase InsO family protein
MSKILHLGHSCRAYLRLYVPIDEGWLYVASVMDLYKCKIVGWHDDERMTKELVLQALDHACYDNSCIESFHSVLTKELNIFWN